jgi:hypothetical protein
MPKFTRISFICGHCRHYNRHAGRYCEKCGRDTVERNAQVHASERAVMYVNPATGERRTPARADTPIPAMYARRGFERQEILSMSKFEKETGAVHEASNFLPGNEQASLAPPSLPTASKEVTDALVKDFAAAMASGPMTENENSPASFGLALPLAKAS